MMRGLHQLSHKTLRMYLAECAAEFARDFLAHPLLTESTFEGYLISAHVARLRGGTTTTSGVGASYLVKSRSFGSICRYVVEYGTVVEGR